MHFRSFGGDSAQVSEVGLGCWQLGSTEWGDVSDEVAERVLHEAVAQGINFFDTADVYGLGVSEERIGRFLKTLHERPFVATKFGRFPKPGWPTNFTRETIRRHTEASLQRLGVECLDLTQLHCLPMVEMQKGEIFDHLRELQHEGKIRRFGASVESMEEAHVCLKQRGLASLQIIFNILRQKPIHELFDKAKELGVAIIVRLPLASGVLAGKFTKATKFGERDHRNFNRDGAAFNVGETFAGIPFEKAVEISDKLRPLVPSGMNMAQMAQRWILDHDAVTTIIPGATKVEQVQSNALASEFDPLSADLHKTLMQFYREEVAPHIRGPY